MTSIPVPHPVIQDNKELDDVDAKRVTTGEVVLRVLQEDNRYINNYLAPGKSSSRSSGSSWFMQASVLGALLATGPIIAKVYSSIKGNKELTEGVEGLDAEISSVFEPSWLDRLKDALFGDSDDESESAPKETPIKPKRDFKDLTGKPDATSAPQVDTRHLAKPSAQVDDALKKASAASGVDYATLYAFAGSESSFNANAKAKTSSAAGLAQFTDGTWDYLTKKEFPELNYTRKDRMDPYKSAKLAGLYIKKIGDSLTRNLGRKPSVGDVYLGYVLGPTGALRFINAMMKSPNAKGADIFPKAAAANKALFYHKNGSPMTLQETYSKVTGKVTNYHAAALQQKGGMSGGNQLTKDESSKADPVKAQTASASPAPQAAAKLEGGEVKAMPMKMSLSPTESRIAEDDDGDEAVADSDDRQRTASAVGIPGGPTLSPRSSVSYIKGKNGIVYSIPG